MKDFDRSGECAQPRRRRGGEQHDDRRRQSRRDGRSGHAEAGDARIDDDPAVVRRERLEDDEARELFRRRSAA